MVLPSVGNAEGLEVMWDISRVNVCLSLVGDFLVSILVEIEGTGRWCFSGVYGPCSY